MASFLARVARSVHAFQPRLAPCATALCLIESGEASLRKAPLACKCGRVTRCTSWTRVWACSSTAVLCYRRPRLTVHGDSIALAVCMAHTGAFAAWPPFIFTRFLSASHPLALLCLLPPVLLLSPHTSPHAHRPTRCAAPVVRAALATPLPTPAKIQSRNQMKGLHPRYSILHTGPTMRSCTCARAGRAAPHRALRLVALVFGAPCGASVDQDRHCPEHDAKTKEVPLAKHTPAC